MAGATFGMVRKADALPGYPAAFSSTTVVVSKSRDIAYELDTFRVTINDESEKPVPHLGKHLVTWKREVDSGK
jgi:hypothetical protein